MGMAGRPTGLLVEGLQDWCKRNIDPRAQDDEPKVPTWTQRLAIVLEVSDSAVGHIWTKAKKDGHPGAGYIDRTKWDPAMNALVESQELSLLARQDFTELCDAAEQGRKPRARNLVDAFLPVRTRLIARLESGKKPEKVISRAFSEATGLVAAWALSERWFTVNDLREGLPKIEEMTGKWVALLEHRVNENWAKDPEELDANLEGEAVASRIRRARAEFFWGLALWLPRLTRWEEDGAELSAKDKRAIFMPVLTGMQEDLWDELHDANSPLPSIFASKEAAQ